MKSLHSKLRECSLCEYKLYEGFYKNAGGMVRPSTKEELRNEIEIRLDRGQYNLNDIDTSKITNMGGLFARFNQNRNLSKIDISGWDTSSVVDMSYMFAWNRQYLKELYLSNFDTSNVTTMQNMFYEWKSLETLNFKNATFTNVSNYTNMFSGTSTTLNIITKNATTKSWLEDKLGGKGTVTIA